MKKFLVASLASVIIFGVLAGTDNAFSALFTFTKDVSSEDNFPSDVEFNNDGSKMFMTGEGTHDVYEYVCATNFDLETCVVSGSETLDTDGVIAAADDIEWNNDGAILFILDRGSADSIIREYTCTPFDVNTCVIVISGELVLDDIGTGVTGIEWSPSGTLLFVTEFGGKDVGEYDCDPFDVSSCSFVDSLLISGDGATGPLDVEFNLDGTKMYVLDDGLNQILEYDCDAFDVSSCSSLGLDESFDVSGQTTGVVGTGPSGMTFNSDGTKLFMSTYDGNIHEYSVPIAFDISSLPASSDPEETGGGGSGCSGDCQEPTMGINKDGRKLVDNGFSYNNNPIDVERFFTPYPLVTVDIGKKNVAEFKIYDNMGPQNIAHFELAFGLGKGESIDKSQAIIIWDKTFDGIETVELEDPDNTLEMVFVNTSEILCQEDGAQMCLLLQVHHTFRAPLEFNVLGSNVWDLKRNSWQNYYNHGIQVEGDSMNSPLTKEIPGPAKHEGLITVTQTELYSDLWIATDGRIFEIWENGSYKLINSDMTIRKDTGNMRDRSHSAFIGWQESQAELATEIFDSSTLVSTVSESFAYEFPDVDSRTQFLIDNGLMNLIRK